MAQSLLQLALSLLIAAQGTNVTPTLRAQAIQTAQIAIAYSTAASAIPLQTSTTTGPGYYGDDGCFYATPVGSIQMKLHRGGIKTSCPSH